MLSLKRWRLVQKWTQRALADQLGSDVSTVKRWEAGTTHPTPYFQEKLVELGFPIQTSSPEPTPQEQRSFPMQPDKREEAPSTYFVEDRSDQNELNRLKIQDRFTNEKLRQALLPQQHQHTFRRVLDVGCGTGGWLIETAKAYPSIQSLVGVDVSKTMLDYARAQAEAQQVSDRVNYLTMDALRMLEFPDKHFDLVNHRFSSSYLRTWEWSNLLREYMRVSRHGGIIQISEAENNVGGTSATYIEWWDVVVKAFVQAGHTFMPETFEQALSRLFKTHGLRQVQATVHPLIYVPGTPDGDALARDLRLAMKTTAPFVQKWMPANEYNELCTRLCDELSGPFEIINYVTTITGIV